ncbi:hypothetical protein MUK42_28576 [Musa troglodytarum]|uniref:Uncharacterized protein n=1 Tax=Musa troglodytarum TaxID=320322 RepID=A0A9E7FXP3_9LILI|nr:hypothetical protein MUK42_28576 [Musa troglodytarum]
MGSSYYYSRGSLMRGECVVSSAPILIHFCILFYAFHLLPAVGLFSHKTSSCSIIPTTKLPKLVVSFSTFGMQVHVHTSSRYPSKGRCKRPLIPQL